MPRDKAAREYTIKFGLSMAVYSVGIILSSWLLKGMEPNNNLRYVISVLPIIPGLFALAAFLQYLRRMDELERRIQFEAFGFSMSITGFLTFTWGLLERVGIPPLDIGWVFPMLIAFWGIGVWIARLHYQ